MIDHTGVAVSDFAKSKQFYTLALAAIGYTPLAEFSAAVTGSSDVVGYGENHKPDFWIHSGTATKPPIHQSTNPPIHVAFRVSSREVVDAFYAAAIAAGGTDNGKPGLRPHYHANYYGAFVRDPDGHNIEAVFHG